MAKQRANLTTIGQFLGDTQQPYLTAPLIAAPFTTITDMSGNARKIPDPSQTLKPVLGIERVMFRSLVLKQDETTSTGQQVWEADSKDARVRFVGNWNSASGSSGPAVLAPTTETTNYFEVSFYGTGLNLLSAIHAGAVDWRATVDGGAEGANFLPNQSTVLNSRNYAPNAVVPVVSGLTLGNHTVRIRKNDTVSGFAFYGVEILNTSATNIIIPKGSVIAAGENATIANQTTTAFNSGFDGNPVLNGRGGRVVVYATPEGRVGKVIQQVDASTLTLGSTNHTNEELIRKINFREFAANRGDDFSGTFTNASRAFTLDDGTTTISGQNLSTDTAFTGRDSLTWAASTGFITVMFVGTGFDMEFQTSGTGSFSGLLGLTIDGGAEVTFAPALARTLRQPIVSGLPYGTHTVKVRLNTGANVTFSDFYIYGPKKPTIPDNAIQIAEYNLMATYSSSTIGVDSVSTGVLRKHATRENIYVGTWAITLAPSVSIGGLRLNSSTSGAYVEYTFFGTGFDLRAIADVTYTANATVTINGLTATTTNFPTLTSSVTNGFTFNNATGAFTQNVNQAGARLTINNLPLGRYTVRVTANTAAALSIETFDIITPIYFPSNKVGSMSIGDLDLINKVAEKPVLDLSKAKAWVLYDGVNQRILSSFNISAVLRQSTGVYRVYLDKPFKNDNFVTVASGPSGQIAVSNSAYPNVRSTSMVNVDTTNSSGVAFEAPYVSLVFFGEQEGE